MNGRPRPLVVVGDALLDRDVTGQVARIAPDSPVPVFEEAGGRDRPGGAGLAAALAARDGRPVRLVSAIGTDAAGDRLRELLAAAGVEVVALPHRGATPEKIRLLAGGQVMLRLDRGGPVGAPGEPDGDLLPLLAGAGAVLVSDYGRGVTGLERVRRALCWAAGRRPVVWDPHPRGSDPVPGVRLVTPNEAELAAGPGAGAGRLAALSAAANRARRLWRAGAVAVTLGAQGALLAHGGTTPMVVPAPSHIDGDACGAGDRFAGAAAAALAGGALISEAVQQGVAEAAAFVAAGGARGYAGPTTPRPDPGPDGGPAPRLGVAAALAVAGAVRESGGTVVATGGCFDLLHPGHVATLQAARALGDCLIVCLNSDASVQALKGPGRPLVAQDDRARLVAALSCVDAVVIFEEHTPSTLLRRLRPHVWVKGGDYFLDDPDNQPVLPEAELLRGWGGQSVVVPYLAGHSTTGLIQTARGRQGKT